MEKKRLTTISEWKNQKVTEKVIDNSKPIDSEDAKIQVDIDEVVKYAKDMELPKNQTIDYVKSIFVDAVKAPEEISVTFVRNNLDKIVQKINEIPDAEWPDQKDFLSIGEMFKMQTPKIWTLFKIDEKLIDTFVSENKHNYLYNKLGYIYVSDIVNINETLTNNLNKIGAKIKYKNVKWLKNIIK